jgi:8-oxo-dGTP pyrophosphatase MutT (NUDIX family)
VGKSFFIEKNNLHATPRFEGARQGGLFRKEKEFMAQYEYGDRIAKTARISPGCSALIFDPTGQKILLTRRTDNGRWCLPGGRMDPGESIEETCVREVWEETGLRVRVIKLLGLYSSPHFIIKYADGNRWQVFSVSFQAEITGGELGLSDETTEVGYFTLAEIEQMDVMDSHRVRIKDALEHPEGGLFK